MSDGWGMSWAGASWKQSMERAEQDYAQFRPRVRCVSCPWVNGCERKEDCAHLESKESL